MLKKMIIAATVSTLSITAAFGADWAYTGNKGPQSWGGTCKSGKSQSPIDISGTEAAVTHSLKMNYNVTPIDMEHTGYTVKMNYAAGSTLMVGAKSYDLKQYHVHTPSEHTVMGQSFPMEIHFAHTNAQGGVAVVSVLVKEGNENRAFNEAMAFIPAKSGAKRNDSAVLVNARDLMPHDKSYYRYMGSATTPPCAEGINWYVLKTPITFSKAQIGVLTRTIGKSNRPIQLRNNRIILDTVSR